MYLFNLECEMVYIKVSKILGLDTATHPLKKINYPQEQSQPIASIKCIRLKIKHSEFHELKIFKNNNSSMPSKALKSIQKFLNSRHSKIPYIPYIRYIPYIYSLTSNLLTIVLFNQLKDQRSIKKIFLPM